MNAGVNITLGIPIDPSFIFPAWKNEPLLEALKGADWKVVFPQAPDYDASLVARKGRQVIGQCSAHRAEKYWDSIEKTIEFWKKSNVQLTKSNEVILKIQELAIEAEKAHFHKMKNCKLEHVFHSRGIAVAPEERGKGLGIKMRKKQVELCENLGGRVIYCQTTNRYAVPSVQEAGFKVLKMFPYHVLAKRLDCEKLKSLDGCYIVWYRDLKEPLPSPEKTME